jgi:hypothetical protein
MKKSELNKYIKENILSALFEEEESTEDIEKKTLAINALAAAKEKAGIEENKGEVPMELLKAIQKYANEDNGMGFQDALKNIKTALYKVNRETRGFSDLEQEEIPMFKGTRDALDSISIREEEDEEPTKKDIKKTKGLAKAKEELALLTQEMKSLAKKYSKAEGEDKEKLVKTLKAKTKLKKELESILDNKKI